MKKALAGYCSVAVFLAASLFSEVIVADWQVYTRTGAGAWTGSYTKATREDAAHFAKIACMGTEKQVKLINLVNGEEQPFSCEQPAQLAPADTPAGQQEIQHCRDNRFTTLWADCDCIAKTLRAMPAGTPVSVGNDVIRQARQACPADAAHIEAHQFEVCKSVLQAQRADAESVCRCVAQKTAADYVAKPNFNLAHTENLRKAALRQCQ